jgi:putative inorganic carbon (HCO3(-)) transporter
MRVGSGLAVLGSRAGSSDRRPEPIRVAVTVLLVSASVGLAAWNGTFGGTHPVLVLTLATVAAVVLVLLALTRFVIFVQVLLVVRASLDLARNQGAGATDLSARAINPASLVGILFLITAALWLAAQHRSGDVAPASPLRRALYLFVLAGLLSLVATANMGVSATELIRILAAVMMFVVLERIMREPSAMRAILRAVYLSAVFPLGFTLIGIVSGAPRSETKDSFVRLLGPFNQSNTFGRYLMVLIIFGVAIYPRTSRTDRRILAVLLAVSSVFLILTYTRSAVVGTMLGLIVVGLLQSKRLLLVLAVTAALFVVVDPTLGSRFTQLGNDQSSILVTSHNSLDWRFTQWAEVLKLSGSNPITGIGLASTQLLSANGQQPHNDFVRAYAEMGIVGFVAYLAVLFSLVRVGWAAVKTSVMGSFDRSVGVGFLGCAIAFIAASVVANVLSNVVTLWYLLAFAAAASAVVIRNTERSEHPERTQPDVEASMS